MQEELYHRLKNAFIIIRRAYDGSGSLERNTLDAAFGELRYARRVIDKNAPKREKQFLLYCIDTLYEFIEEGDRQKIYDFADTVHNVPEIFIGTRKFSSFSREFNTFCEKYGYEYFSDYNKFLLKNIPLYLFPLTKKVSGASVAKTTPWLIGSVCFCLLLPMVIYTITVFLWDAPNSAWLLMGEAGSFIIGVGLANLAAWIFDEYYGHILTTVSLLLGGGLVISSILFMFPIAGKNIINESAVMYLVISATLLLFLGFFYLNFRMGVAEWLKRKKNLNMTQQKKLKKGVFNFLWYLAIQKEVGLGWLFFLNLIFTLAFSGAILISVLCLFFPSFAAENNPLLVISYAAFAVMYMFYRIQENIINHKTPIVLCRENPGSSLHRRKIYDSIFLDLFFIGFVGLILYMALKGSVDLQ